jgi:hypothetical protein
MYKNKHNSELDEIGKSQKRIFGTNHSIAKLVKARDKLTTKRYKINQSLLTKRIKV